MLLSYLFFFLFKVQHNRLSRLIGVFDALGNLFTTSFSYLFLFINFLLNHEVTSFRNFFLLSFFFESGIFICLLLGYFLLLELLIEHLSSFCIFCLLIVSTHLGLGLLDYLLESNQIVSNFCGDHIKTTLLLFKLSHLPF